LALKAGSVCRSEHWDLLRGHTERELQFAVAELRKLRADQRHRSSLSARQLAFFMHDVQTEEAFLLRDREAANREVIALAEGDEAPLPRNVVPPRDRSPLFPDAGPAVAQRPTTSAWDCLDLDKLPKFKSF
jgi:hypothetical protein